jgi:hypothetical protein
LMSRGALSFIMFWPTGKKWLSIEYKKIH